MVWPEEGREAAVLRPNFTHTHKHTNTQTHTNTHTDYTTYFLFPFQAIHDTQVELEAIPTFRHLKGERVMWTIWRLLAGK